MQYLHKLDLFFPTVFICATIYKVVEINKATEIQLKTIDYDRKDELVKYKKELEESQEELKKYKLQIENYKKSPWLLIC